MIARERRALVLGAVVIVSTLVAGRGIPAGISYVRASVQQVDERLFAIGQLQSTLARSGTLADSLSRLEGAMGSLSDRMLMGRSEDEAQLALRRRLTTIAGPFALRIDSIISDQRAAAGDTTGRPSESGPIIASQACAFIASDLEGAVRLIDALEVDPVLWIAKLTVQLRAPSAPQSPQLLSIRLEFGGWRVK